MSSPILLALTVVFALMALRLKDLYLGGHYVCPSCGTRREGRHTDECPWRR